MLPLIGAGIGALGSVLGGIFGGAAQADAQRKAQEATAKALEIIQAVGAPPDVAQQIVLDPYRIAGVYTPAVEKAVTQQFSKLADMEAQAPLDRSTRDAQVQALEDLGGLQRQYEQIAQQGASAQDIQQENRLRQQVNQDNQARLASIQQQMAQRGQASSGAELASILASSQQALNTQANQSNDFAARQQQARLSALSALSGLSGQEASQAGNLRSADFNVANALYQQQTDRAKAADELSRFNVLQQAGAQQRNVGNANQGQLFNLQNMQTLLNQNVSQSNTEQQRQRTAQEWMYNQRASQAGAQAQALTNQANRLTQQGANQAQSAMSIGAGLGGLGKGLVDAYGQSQQQDLAQQRQALLDNRFLTQTGILGSDGSFGG